MSQPRPGDAVTGSEDRRTPTSDARRDAVLAILDSARADGRISNAEHRDRYRAAALSRFEDELTPLIADLSLRPMEVELRTTGLWADDPFANQWTFGPFRSGKRNATRTLRERLVLPALTVVVLGMMLGAVIVGGPEPEYSVPTETVVTAPAPLHTADGLVQVLESARAEFGDHRVESLTVSHHGATLVHEDPARPGMRTHHDFDGSWDADTEQERPADEVRGVLFRLDAVDRVAMASAVEQAPALLGIPDGVAQHVSIRGDVLAEPTYTVSVSAGGRRGSVEFARDGQVRELIHPD